MELMSLLAKLTLDKQEYDKGLKEAENDAKGLKIDTPKIPKPDNTDFDAGLKEAEGTGNLFKEVMTGVWNGIKDAIVVTGITSAVMAVVGAMRQGIDMAIENGDAISKGAKNLDISTKAYQEYEYALGKSGLKVKDLSKAMDGLGKIYSGDLTDKQKKYVDELKEMGFVADEAAGNEKNLASMMKALADYQGSDKGQIINWLFGSNQNWDGYFNQTSSEIEKLKDQAEDLGLIMPDEAIQNATEFKDATEEINARIEGIKQSFGESVLPMLKDVAQTMARIMAFFGGGNKSIAEQLAGDDKDLAKDLLTIEGTASAAGTLVDKLYAMGSAEKLTAEQQAEWKATADWLIKNIPSLSEKINADTLAINGNKDALLADIEAWKKLSTERAVTEAKEAKQAKMMEANEEAIDKVATARAKANDALVKQGERVAEVNRLLADPKNKELKDMFSSIYGTTELTGQESNLDAMLDWMKTVGYEFADTSTFENLTEEYNKLMNEQMQLQSEAESYQKQLAQAEKEYESWCQAIDELYGTVSDDAGSAVSDINSVGEALEALPDKKVVTLYVDHQNFTGAQMAIGGTVPYDNYPALLHRGEKVLTATEVRKGEGSGTDLSHLEERIAAAIRAGMEGVSVNSYLNGRAVTEEVNRNNMRDVKGRRFSR